jgi:phosphoribosylanthranilate isomerase
MKPLVKICGITNEDDALYSARSGADILGLILYEKSPRFVSPERAAEITSRCREELKALPLFAGVFVKAKVSFVVKAAAAIGLDFIQLHGDEDHQYLEDLMDSLGKAGLFAVKIIRAFRVKDRSDVDAAAEYPSDYFLFDTFSEKDYGGTGKPFDWEIIRDFSGRDRLFLAGGISAENVLDAIRGVSPYAIDLSSSLEESSGKKDKKKIDTFFRALRNP